MAASWSTPPPRPGWCRCGCTICRNGEVRALPGTEGGASRSGRQTGRDRLLRRRSSSRARSRRTAPRPMSPMRLRPGRRMESRRRPGLRAVANGGLMRRDAAGAIAPVDHARSGGRRNVAHVAGVSARRPTRDLPRHARHSRLEPASGSRRSMIPHRAQRLIASDAQAIVAGHSLLYLQ